MKPDFRLATQLVGSYSKPPWLTDHSKAAARDVSWWRVPPEFLPEALDDVVRLAIADQERAGLTVITDGEQRRQSFSAYFFRLGGIDPQSIIRRDPPAARASGSFIVQQGDPASNTGLITTFPVVRGPLEWNGPLSVDDFLFLKRLTRRLTKATVIGPSTMACRLHDEYYGDFKKLVFAVADAMNHEVRALEGAGADLIQIDDPDLHMRLGQVEATATEALDRMVRGVSARTAVHVCYGYARTAVEKRIDPDYARVLQLIAASRVDEMSIEYEQPGHQPDLLEAAGSKAVILGLLNLSPEAPVEPVDHIVRRARAAMEIVSADRLRLAPDCGMWFLPSEHAFRKIRALALAGEALRNELD
jgi:5-methyltetrahydropteroyltriglutamate--homocysteine methyltransferase